MKVREAILTTVNIRQGINGVDLVLTVMGIVGPLKLDNEEYNKELEALVKAAEIVELEYILPQMNYRIKSIYFPKGTVIHGQSKSEHSPNAESNSIR